MIGRGPVTDASVGRRIGPEPWRLARGHPRDLSIQSFGDERGDESRGTVDLNANRLFGETGVHLGQHRNFRVRRGGEPHPGGRLDSMISQHPIDRSQCALGLPIPDIAAGDQLTRHTVPINRVSDSSTDDNPASDE